jgi:hypothetical protein
MEDLVMGLLSKIFGVGDAVPAISAVGNIVDNLFTSKDEKLTHEEVKLRLLQQPNLAQVELNKIEAAHRSVFVAGWRPAIGWVAATGLFFFYVPQYMMASVVWIKLIVANDWQLVPYPVGADGLLELVMALLGMGALRTMEKMKGKAK